MNRRFRRIGRGGCHEDRGFLFIWLFSSGVVVRIGVYLVLVLMLWKSSVPKTMILCLVFFP